MKNLVFARSWKVLVGGKTTKILFCAMNLNVSMTQALNIKEQKKKEIKHKRSGGMVTHWIRRNVWYLQKVNFKVYPNQVLWSGKRIYVCCAYLFITSKSFFLCCVWVFFLHIYMCTSCMLVRDEALRGHQIPWNWNYACFWATTWVLGTEAGCSARATTGTLNHWVISPIPLQTHLRISW